MDKKYNVLKPVYDIDNITNSIKTTLKSGWTGDGGLTKVFEKKWSQYTGYNNSIYVNSCTAALHLSLLVLKDKYPRKRKVIVPDITFISSAAVVLQSSLELILCDVDESLCLDPKALKKLVSDEILAVVFVGIGGNSQNLIQVSEICKSSNISLILDAAHMSGSKISPEHSPHLGEYSDYVCYSFQAVKNLGIADSGMLCTQSQDSLEEISKYRWMGIDKTTYQRTESLEKNIYKWEYEIDRLGYKYNGNALVASCCLAILPDLDKNNKYRRSLRNKYIKSFSSLDEIKVIPHLNENSTSAHLAQILLKESKSSNERNEFISKLNRHNIFPGVHYRSISKFKYYKKFGQNIINSNNISDKIISLPCHLDISINDIDFILDKIKSVLA
ncbi:DegT/DnrJ/EryC1/StrS family aminotransferase [Prochlorococcus marinus]|uniref:Aminotransferase DegT n=1 Tax=Prochlorococcus marinus XMU1408 TaxID=2213228 RepID=A0A318R725_PROMR|nr:DegT/DnrJ/EryC1/StrS aminotransferase family protein [Prochlorococcus marinus]PYE01168.1 aminotransferase DegT [Prochlorococcus marinus XMU1408]